MQVQHRSLCRRACASNGGIHRTCLVACILHRRTKPSCCVDLRLDCTEPDFATWYAGRIISEILATEGVGALFKGALPRACWVAPLGAMNFAGYELAKNALKERSSEAAAPMPVAAGIGGGGD